MQTLLISREKFLRPASALAWAKKYGFVAKKVDAAKSGSERTYHRIRQEPPGAFTRSSFRMIDLRPGVKAVIGCPKRL